MGITGSLILDVFVIIGIVAAIGGCVFCCVKGCPCCPQNQGYAAGPVYQPPPFQSGYPPNGYPPNQYPPNGYPPNEYTPNGYPPPGTPMAQGPQNAPPSQPQMTT